MMMPQMQTKPSTLLCSTDEVNYYTCTPDAACAAGTFHKYSPGTFNNWLVQFDLLCESTAFLKLIYYFFFGGFFLGAVLLAPLADYYGRKGVLVLSGLLLCLVYLKAVFTADPITCALVLCCSGVLVGAYYCVGIAYLTELATQESAMIYTIMFHMAFPVSGTLVAVLLRWFRSWTVVTTIFALLPLVMILYVMYIAESPRYLVAAGNYRDASYAANVICETNTGKKKRWIFTYEHASYMQDYARFSEERDKKFFQHCYFLSYSSSRYYLLAFFVLLFTSGFAFSGLALVQKQIFANAFMNSLLLQATEAVLLFLTGFFVQHFGHKRTIGYSLLVTGALGILCTIVSYVSDSAFGFVGYLTKLAATVAFVSAVAFSAELCPARVRATGFGMCVGAGVFGLVCGGFVLEFHDNMHILFGVVAACGLLIMPFLKEPAMYSTNDDIYEINELRKKNFKEDLQQQNQSMALSDRKSSAERKSAPSTADDLPTLFTVEGSRLVKEKQEPLGFDQFYLGPDGVIRYPGKDEGGEFALTGKIVSGNSVTITKKYKEGKEIKFEGAVTRANVGGTWSDENEKGDFTFLFKLQMWKGTVGEDSQKVEWFLEQAGNKVHGLGVQEGKAVFISGGVHEDGTVRLAVRSEDGKRTVAEGKLDGGAIQGPGVSLRLVKDP